VSRNVPVVARVILVIVADIGGFVLFQHDARVAETWLASELAGLIGPGRFSVVKGTSVLVTPLHQTPFFVLVTSSCSSISSVCSIACLACLLRGVPLARRTLALLAAVAAVVVGNVVRIAASLTVGLASGRIALVLFHDWVGSTFAFAYTLGGFILLLYLVLPNRRARTRQAVPVV
jgi:exosortase/archaeosortase family protein